LVEADFFLKKNPAIAAKTTNPKMYNKMLLPDDDSDDSDDSDDAGASVVSGAVVSAGAIVESEAATVVSVVSSVRTIAFSETTVSPFVFVTRTAIFDAAFGIFNAAPGVTAVHEPASI
jgi:hypothetical protein